LDFLLELAMDWDAPTIEEHELEYLAHKHGTSVEKIKEVTWCAGGRSREAVEAALDMELPSLKRFVFGPV
jgi:hypothetical protein